MRHSGRSTMLMCDNLLEMWLMWHQGFGLKLSLCSGLERKEKALFLPLKTAANDNERIFIKDTLKRVRGLAPVPSKVWTEAPWGKTGSPARDTGKNTQSATHEQPYDSLTSEWSSHL